MQYAIVNSKILLFILGIQFLIFSSTINAGPVASEILLPENLIKVLQSGGHILYMRHSKTDHTQKDKVKHVLTDCSSQRNLSEEGKEQAKKLGLIIQQLNIPIGHVISSPYCRCKDTAQLTFGEFDIEPNLQFSISKNAEESEQLGKMLYEIMVNIPSNSANDVIVGHTSNLKDGLGVWPKPEGVIAVFQNTKKGLVYKGLITPDMWPGLK